MGRRSREAGVGAVRFGFRFVKPPPPSFPLIGKGTNSDGPDEQLQWFRLNPVVHAVGQKSPG